MSDITTSGEFTLFKPPLFRCPKHGVHEHVINVSIPSHKGHWCMLCAIEAFDQIGILKCEPTDIKS